MKLIFNPESAGPATYAQILLIWLKLIHGVDMSWWAVFSPVWIACIVIVSLMIVFGLLVWKKK